MIYRLTNDMMLCLKTVTGIAEKDFSDEQKDKFNPVIQKINEAPEAPGGYLLELDAAQEFVLLELLDYINDTYEDIKHSSRFQELRNYFGLD